MRRDIQFLRGIAVIVVVIYHSGLELLEHGYLGVDIFFVLSGFLITSVILKNVDNGTFTFTEFYLRRAKRLLPALYSTLFFTTILSLSLLTNQQWQDYIEQLQGALTFTANIVLPTQSGYFENTSEGKPLLHIWSLSLEEQYYFLLPVTLILIPRKYQLIGLTVLIVLSMTWCFSWIYGEESTTPFLWRIADLPSSQWSFYLLPTRAWELLAGSICAWLVINKNTVFEFKPLKSGFLLIILLMCAININNEHPSIESFIVVTATAFILLGKDNWLPQYKSINVIEKVGDWSYSIYLVHWPLFAFSYVGYVGDAPPLINLLLIFFSIFLGYLQYKYVETPFREGRLRYLFSNWYIAIGITTTLLGISFFLGLHANNYEQKITEIRKVNYGLHKKCDGLKEAIDELTVHCKTSSSPNTVLWGDSYAMHHAAGLKETNHDFTQLTKSACGPIMGLSLIDDKHNFNWAKDCLKFNTKTFEYIKNNDLEYVILSSRFSSYFDFANVSYLTNEGVETANYELFVRALRNTILEIKALNITPIVVSPPPESGFNVGECLERLYVQAWLFREDCSIKVKAYEEYQSLTNKTLESIEDIVEVIWLKEYLCNSEYCETSIDKTMLYRDEGHLTVGGSPKLWNLILRVNRTGFVGS